VSALWAVTCYFNPMRYARRLENFRRFRARVGVPLVAVELGYDGQRHLGPDDADVCVHLPGLDVLWQKERLLNVAIAALPDACTLVAWLDCDVVFARDGWADRAAALLDRVPLVQLFREVRYQGPEGTIARTRPSVVAGVAAGMPVERCLEHPSKDHRPGTYACGLAWAARRALVAEHGLYDENIIGGGDRAMVCAGYGCFEHEAEWHRLNDAQRRAYRAWAEPFHRAVRGMLAHLDEPIEHLWHGDVATRGFGARHDGLAAFDFDPKTDLRLDEHGGWRWATDKPALHRFVRDYFAARSEDG
jgi:hypothetical protein